MKKQIIGFPDFYIPSDSKLPDPSHVTITVIDEGRSVDKVKLKMTPVAEEQLGKIFMASGWEEVAHLCKITVENSIVTEFEDLGSKTRFIDGMGNILDIIDFGLDETLDGNSIVYVVG